MKIEKQNKQCTGSFKKSIKLITKSALQKEQRPAYFLQQSVHNLLSVCGQQKWNI